MAKWPGTDAELDALRQAVGRNCGCEWSVGPKLMSTRTKMCDAHAMLESTDQSLLDHLVFGKRLRAFLQAQEFDKACLVRPQP